MKHQLEIPFKTASLYEPGQGYIYKGKIVQVSEVTDGKPVFKTLAGEVVEAKGSYAVRAKCYDKPIEEPKL